MRERSEMKGEGRWWKKDREKGGGVRGKRRERILKREGVERKYRGEERKKGS